MLAAGGSGGAQAAGNAGGRLKDFMLQVRSSLDVADNTRRETIVWNIGVTGRNQRYAGIGDVIKAHIKEAAPDGTVKKGEVVDAVIVRTRQTIRRRRLVSAV
jgi:large subunit ribosomal protein L14